MAVATGYWGCAKFGKRIGVFMVTARYAVEADVVAWFTSTNAALDECGLRNRAL